ncbi:MAG: HlyD family efflux transporter periplasmic adaptor subunit [Gemmatimonadetes bacterium]|nr:HlyD family efflux transporter periplasmic adaptor subunit [Gemmatimonadota bacterium]
MPGRPPRKPERPVPDAGLQREPDPDRRHLDGGSRPPGPARGLHRPLRAQAAPRFRGADARRRAGRPRRAGAGRPLRRAGAPDARPDPGGGPPGRRVRGRARSRLVTLRSVRHPPAAHKDVIPPSGEPSVDVPRQATNKNRRRWIIGGSAIGAVALVTLALSRLEPAPPSVDRSTIWTDTVRRGPMVRQVRGPGTLAAEEVRWVPAVTQGRVERKLVQPGTPVTAGTILVELSNPDVDRQALEAQRQLAAAESELTTLRSNLQNQILTQQATIATVQSDYNEAMRQARANDGLAGKELVSQMEVDKARDHATELKTRLDVERQRLGFLRESMQSQLTAQQGQVKLLQGIVSFQRGQVESMHVRAGTDGVLQELPLEMGQWVNSGATLAKVVQPGRLKAVLRIPETQAKDVTVGQFASVDTRNGIVKGRVVRIDPAVQNGTVTVDVALEGPLPRGARPDLSVDGTIDIERLNNVLYVGRPAYGQAESTVGLFRLTGDGREAERVNVKLGRGSASTIEVVQGLKPGDVVILSDMSQWDSSNKVRLN